MPGRARSIFHLLAGAALSAGATHGWDRLREEFPQVRANCGLRGAVLERDRTDKRLLRLVFRRRNNAVVQAERNGSLACVEHWARERGWRLTTEPGGKGI